MEQERKFKQSFVNRNNYKHLTRDVPPRRDWSLDTCCSEAEIPSLAGME
jgi:hypothetical protein